MNVVTAADLKRRGLAAIEEGLQQGTPLHIVKHQQPIAVVLSMDAYRELTAGQAPQASGMTAVRWLLSQTSTQTQTRADIDADLERERGAWSKP